MEKPEMKWAVFQGAFPAGRDLAACLHLARAAGFAGIELSLEDGSPLLPEAVTAETATIRAIERSVGLDVPRPGGLRRQSTHEELRALRTQAEASGLAITSVSTMQLFHYPLSSPVPAVRARALELVRAMVDAMALLGGDVVLVTPGRVTRNEPYQAVWERSQAALAELLPYAEARHIVLGVENVWNKFLLSPLEFARFLDDFQSPAIGAYFDVANILTYGYPDQWLEYLGSRVKRVHFKDYRLDIDDIRGFTSLLQGDVPWDRVAAALERIGYSGWIVVEVAPYRAHGAQVLPDSIAALRSIFAGPKDVIPAG
jgi:hexulose-6-phosphate isomerase